MDVFYAYSLGTSGWLTLQAVPLVISPTIIVTLLSPDVHQPTSLEQYLARSLGFAFLALSILCLLLTGMFPLSLSDTDSSTSPTTTAAEAYAVPTIILTMLYHSTTAFYTYARFNRTGQSAYILATICSGTLAAIGLWTILFGSSSGRISRRTGADKRTSGWPFKNAEADKKRLGKKTH